jgi:hypothetical protein
MFGRCGCAAAHDADHQPFDWPHTSSIVGRAAGVLGLKTWLSIAFSSSRANEVIQ